MKLLTALLGIMALLWTVTGAAASEIHLDYEQIELNPGESLTLTAAVSTPKNIPDLPLWTVLDPSVADISPEGIVTALKPGKTVIFAESFDQQANTICKVRVNGTPDPANVSYNETFSIAHKLSVEDLTKIKDPALHDLLELIQSLPADYAVAAQTRESSHKVLVYTVPGKEYEVSEAAYALGATDATVLQSVSLVTLQATLGQITELIADNADIVEVQSDIPLQIDFESGENGGLEGHVEELTGLSHLREGLGLTGKGSVIAVIDSGFNTNHPEFSGRVKHQKCFASTYTASNNRYRNPCVNEDDAFPTKTEFPAIFKHGTHVAGIAGGTHGIAPEAELIFVSFASEQIFPMRTGKDCLDGVIKNGFCHKKLLVYSDELKGYDYLLGLIKQGERIDVVNMSYGAASYSSDVCESPNRADYLMLKQLREAGVILVGASGNEEDDFHIVAPACYPQVTAVAALEDQDVPTVSDFSNYGLDVDITAPGFHIYSANHLYGINRNAKEFIADSGTSTATPVVAGYIALLRQLYPEKSADEVETLLRESPLTVTNISRYDDHDQSKTYSIQEFYGASFKDYEKPIVNFSDYQPFEEKPVIANVGADSLTIRLPDSLFTASDPIYLTVLRGNKAVCPETLIDPLTLGLAAARTFTVDALQPETAYLVRVRTAGTRQCVWMESVTTARVSDTPKRAELEVYQLLPHREDSSLPPSF